MDELNYLNKNAGNIYIFATQFGNKTMIKIMDKFIEGTAILIWVGTR